MKLLKPGDLAFFGEKKVTHVGILINKNKIIHAFGSVRIDYINEKGIINSDSNILTHHLKKLIEIDPTNIEALKTAKNIYYTTDDLDNFKLMNVKLQELEN